MNKIFHDGKYYSELEIKEIVKRYYQSAFSRKIDRHVQMQTLFPDTLDNKSKILDYGCGMGGVSQLFYDRYGCNVDGVDISENELIKAKIAFGDNAKLNFLLLSQFGFPKNTYDLVFSSQVIEHVHNPGNYLSNINNMLKNDGYLLIGLPNIVNINYLINLILFSNKRAIKTSKKILNSYNKASDHINGWDPFHFINLCSSCGFELVKYIPTEETPISFFLQRIPFIGKYIYRLPFTTRLSYTMFFLFKKSKNIKININD
ncbi:SAM-dependent methyltransferase [Campylobacter iguaniorum]|uniref:SAM-dependent methyltransferase n=1 Tax=Campylobacter iguaniorum TaxID=1244531 RepID=A0A076F7D0_9BACT|nr:class I SAM-dependent methyltransferase [Campylobacter iguaniorum]AII13931.1 SAM-dependent methyltransferase [Campylobacter iguaniorum]